MDVPLVIHRAGATFGCELTQCHQAAPAELRSDSGSVRLLRSDDRQAVLESRIGTAGPGVGATSQPPVDATRLDLAASQFIDDMEDKAEVPDRWGGRVEGLAVGRSANASSRPASRSAARSHAYLRGAAHQTAAMTPCIQLWQSERHVQGSKHMKD
jgi:hypothetical protein